MSDSCSSSKGTVQKKTQLLIHFTITPGNKLYGESFKIFVKLHKNH